MVIAVHRWFDRAPGNKNLATCISSSAVADTIINILTSRYDANNYLVYSEYYKQYKSKYKIKPFLANKVINYCKPLKEGKNTLITI